MSGGESSRNNATVGTPVKALKRDVRGLLSLQQESPSQSDVLWSSLDSPHKARTVGGKSKTLKSSNQLTPKNNAIRKKYYSSPVLVARVPDENNDELKKLKILENQRILEEFHRQFSNESYVPRNLLDNLDENLEDSIVASDDKINKQDSDIINDEIDKLTDYNLTDQEDFEALAEMEEQARQFLDKKESQKPSNMTSNKPDLVVPKQVPIVPKPVHSVPKTAPIMPKPVPSVSKPVSSVSKPVPPVSKPVPSDSKPIQTSKVFNYKNPKTAPTSSKEIKNDYFDSDDDDIILSVPLEQLSAKTSKPVTISSKKEQPTKTNNFSHTSVIPTKRENINVSSDKNRIQNQSNSKLFVQSKSVPGSATSEPLPKRRCTAEEIAEKRRQAMQRREAYLQSLRESQKPKD